MMLRMVYLYVIIEIPHAKFIRGHFFYWMECLFNGAIWAKGDAGALLGENNVDVGPKNGNNFGRVWNGLGNSHVSFPKGAICIGKMGDSEARVCDF